MAAEFPLDTHVRDLKIPSYRLHRASGQAVVTLSGRDIDPGPHGTPAGRGEYR